MEVMEVVLSNPEEKNEMRLIARKLLRMSFARFCEESVNFVAGAGLLLRLPVVPAHPWNVNEKSFYTLVKLEKLGLRSMVKAAAAANNMTLRAFTTFSLRYYAMRVLSMHQAAIADLGTHPKYRVASRGVTGVVYFADRAEKEFFLKLMEERGENFSSFVKKYAPLIKGMQYREVLQVTKDYLADREPTKGGEDIWD